MSDQNEKSLLKVTNQSWKLSVDIYSGYVCIAFVFISFYFGGLQPTGAYMLLLILGITFGIGGFLFAINSLKCPQCGAKWFWSAISEKHPEGSFEWLKKVSACPKCNYPS